MTHKALAQTIKCLEAVAALNNGVLVSYSGGKDSLVVLDLCAKVFKRVVCFFMSFGQFACQDHMLNFARARYGVPILIYPHPGMVACLRDGVYCPNYYTLDDLPNYDTPMLHRVLRLKTGIEHIADGMRKFDEHSRRQHLGKTKGQGARLIHPIEHWNKHDVLAYLKLHNIPVPDTHAGATTGIDLTTRSLLWLHDKHPRDFQSLCRTFPYAQAVVYRRDWHGVA